MKKITIDNIEYKLYAGKKTAVVIGYKDNPDDVIIPEFIKDLNEKYKVTEIRDRAFSNSSLTSITIPNSVIIIEKDAFICCENLTSITIPDSVTKIGDYAFCCCEKLKSVTIPDSVTYIGDGVFFNCSSLTSITIPDSVTFIGNSAFECIGITLPKRYTEDGKLIAYKGFNVDMTCRNIKYEEGKSYEIEGKIKCCEKGFHACTNPLDVFNYYDGEIGKDVVIHEVYLSGDIDYNNYDSKVCSSKIEIGKRLTMKDINNIINNK